MKYMFIVILKYKINRMMFKKKRHASLTYSVASEIIVCRKTDFFFISQIISHLYNKLHLIQVGKTIIRIYTGQMCRPLKKCLYYIFLIFRQSVFMRVSPELKDFSLIFGGY